MNDSAIEPTTTSESERGLPAITAARVARMSDAELFEIVRAVRARAPAGRRSPRRQERAQKIGHSIGNHETAAAIEHGMNEDTISTFERHELLLDAIQEATEEAIVSGHIPALVVRQIEEATRRLRQLVRDEVAAPGRDDDLLDEHDLAEWERNASLQAAVLAAMLSNEQAEG